MKLGETQTALSDLKEAQGPQETRTMRVPDFTNGAALPGLFETVPAPAYNNPPPSGALKETLFDSVDSALACMASAHKSILTSGQGRASPWIKRRRPGTFL